MKHPFDKLNSVIKSMSTVHDIPSCYMDHGYKSESKEGNI